MARTTGRHAPIDHSLVVLRVFPCERLTLALYEADDLLGEALAERFTLCHFPTGCTVDLRSHSKFLLVTFVQLLAKRVYG